MNNNTLLPPPLVLLERRRQMMSRNIVEIEYLQFTGTQYMNTNLYGTNATRLDIVYTPISGGATVVAGANDPQQVAAFTIATAAGNYAVSRRDGKVTSAYNWVANRNYTISNRKDGLYINGTRFSAWTANEFTTIQPIYVGTGNLTGFANGKFYGVKIWENDTLVLDLIPVRIGTKGYFRDTISGKLFANQGTGDFILGQDK